MEEYYIHIDEQLDGPYDLVGVIRKVRNGVVKEDTLITSTANPEPKPAGSYAELESFFQPEADAPRAQAPKVARAKTLGAALTGGLEFLKSNSGVIVYTGLFLVIWLMLAIIFIYGKGIVAITIGIAASYLVLAGYLAGLLRYIRGNPVGAGVIVSWMKPQAMPLVVLSVIMAMAMLPGVVFVTLILTGYGTLISVPLLSILLLILLTFFAFSPLLIIDQKKDFWDALRISKEAVLANNAQNLGLVFALISLNFILLFLLPLTLPVTMAALVEIYDEQFS